MKISGSPYFTALCKVGIEKVVDNVDTGDLMEFLETHIAAAAFTKNNQVTWGNNLPSVAI